MNVLSKNKIFLSLVLFAELLNGFDFGEVGDFTSNAGDYSSSFDKYINTDTYMNIINDNKSGAMDLISSSLGGVANGLLPSSLMSTCYYYRPIGVKSFSFSLDPCDLLSGLSGSFDPCESMPDLESIGYIKRYGTSENLNSFCKSLKNEIITRDWISVSENFDSTTNFLSEVSIIDSMRDGKKVKKKYQSIAMSPTGINHIHSNKLLMNVIASNDTKVKKIMDKIADNSNIVNGEQVDFSSVNVDYNTMEDYEKSRNDLVEKIEFLSTDINPTKFYNILKAELISINADPSFDATSRVKQKEAFKESLLEQFRDSLKKYTALNTALYEWEYIKNDDSHAYPVKTVVSIHQPIKRMEIIFAIESGKIKYAKKVAEFRIEEESLYEEAVFNAEKAIIQTKVFNRELEYQKIISLLSN